MRKSAERWCEEACCEACGAEEGGAAVVVAGPEESLVVSVARSPRKSAKSATSAGSERSDASVGGVAEGTRCASIGARLSTVGRTS